MPAGGRGPISVPCGPGPSSRVSAHPLVKSSQRFDYSALAEILGQRALVEPERLAVALQTCAQSGFPFPEILVDNGLITDWEIARVVCELYGLPFLPVESYTPQPSAGDGLDNEFLAMNKIIPMERHGGLLTVCMPVLVPAEVLGILSAQTGLSVLPIVGTVTGNRTWILERQAEAARAAAQADQGRAATAEPGEVDAALPADSTDGDVAIDLGTETPTAELEQDMDAGSLEAWSSLFDEADAAVNIALEDGDEDPDAKPDAGPAANGPASVG